MYSLEQIKSKNDIKSFNIKRVYEDDNLLCVDVEINGVGISFNWYDEIDFLYLWKHDDKSFKILLGGIEIYYMVLRDKE